MNRGDLFRIHWHAFNPETGLIELKYELDGQGFTETYKLPPVCRGGDPATVERLLGTLHVLAGVSYYKTSLPQEIEIAHPVSPADATFFTKVYEKGLGELFFRNQIDPRGVVHFEPNVEASVMVSSASPEPAEGSNRDTKRLKILVPTGGGKDAIVTAMLLKEKGFEPTLLRVGAHTAIDAQARAFGFPLLVVDRRLDPLLFELNAQGALNGHVPITAILSVLAVFIAETAGFDTVAFSNERSANDGNMVWSDLEINHQWSKSLEFERALRTHLAETCGTHVNYVSLIRPWSELRIVKEFVRFPEAFPLFTSCNRNWHVKGSKLTQGLWCRACPKCAFTGLLLAAFLPRAQVVDIQGGDVVADPALVPLYEEMLGLRGHKPFECVGTPHETAAAFHLAHARSGYDDSPAMQRFLASPIAAQAEQFVSEALTPSDDHCLSPELLALLPTP